jgi:hypothetical protein
MTDKLLYFSYGANMSHKVLQKRQIKPTQSWSAQAEDGYLSFAHRGGFATIRERGRRGSLQAPTFHKPHGVLHVRVLVCVYVCVCVHAFVCAYVFVYACLCVLWLHVHACPDSKPDIHTVIMTFRKTRSSVLLL